MVKIVELVVLFLVVCGYASAQLRCGVVDDSTLDRTKRYTFMNTPHENMTITYRITDYSKQKDLNHDDIDNVIARAFDIWSQHTDLKFVRKPASEAADITVLFAVRDHGDGFPFDGPGNVLAHALKRFVHFDDDETWKATAKAEGTSLFKVAVHEIGHALGLGHSDEENSIMFFAHTGDDEHEFKLHEDDIKGIQEIYGEKTIRPAFDLNLCKDSAFDTMFDTPDGKLYIFKTDKYYEIDGTAIKAGPKSISEKWVGLPVSIDGAFSKGGKTYFFKGGEYWRYTGDKMDAGYPERLDRWYSEIPNSIDDVTVMKDGKIYFFKGSEFYRMDEFKEQYDTIYKNDIAKEFKGVPKRIDAVHYSSHWSLTFFFKIDKFYAYDSNREAYAIPTNSYFFNCPRA